jgi:hypothetical protein
MSKPTCVVVETRYDEKDEVTAALKLHGVEFDGDGIPIGRESTPEVFSAVAVRRSAKYRLTHSVYLNKGWTEIAIVATATAPGRQCLGNGEKPAAVAMVSRSDEPTRFLQIGCEHEWAGGQSGRCYYTYSCPKCGCRWEVDSSD